MRQDHPTLVVDVWQVELDKRGVDGEAVGMQTPHRITFDKFLLDYRSVTDYCGGCGSKMELVDVCLSLHLAEFGDACAGEGRVFHCTIPWCKRCETRPEVSGCIHVPWLT